MYLYGETQLNSNWFPSRIRTLNANLAESTIIDSKLARQHNIIGIDLTVPIDRTKILDEPEESCIIRDPETSKPYGETQSSAKRRPHRRRQSEVPDFVPTLPINPKAVFPGISDEHIELLDHCVGKLQQRTGKVDVTWEELAKYEEMGMTIHSQPVDDGTCRYQVNFEVEKSLEECAKTFLEYESASLHLEAKQLEAEKVKEFSDDFYCVRQTVRPGRGIFQASQHNASYSIGPPKESVVYWWTIKLENKIYSTYVSMEPDDPLGFAVVDESSDLIRSTYNPGCGYIMEAIDERKTKIAYLVHFNLGGYFPKALIDNLVLRNLYINTRSKVHA